MKFLMIFLSIVGVSYAGVGVVTPEIEAEALRLWQQYCDGASEGGNDGNSIIYCKKSRDNFEENLQHEIALPAAPEPPQQVVFVQPPSYNYKHQVIVTGGGGSAPRTVIYVKPAKHSNTVNIVDQTNPAQQPEKPRLFFLKGNHGAGPSPTSPPRPGGGYNYDAPRSRLELPGNFRN